MKASYLTTLVFLLAALPSQAQQKKGAPPAPLNQGVRYEPYPGTDIAQISYKISRQEFRVGHAPYKPERFQVAECVLVCEHTRKYQRPDMVAEMKLAPRNTQAELMSNKTFQKRFQSQVEGYRKLLKEFTVLRFPKSCEEAVRQYRLAMEDEIFLAETISKRLFLAQQIRDRELTCQDLRPRFRDQGADDFERLCSAFEQEGNLLAFYEGLRSSFIDSRLARGRELAEKIMQQVGVEYAVAAEEKEKEITR